jgi:hypothetical protein
LSKSISKPLSFISRGYSISIINSHTQALNPVKQCHRKRVLIIDDKVLGDYDSDQAAYRKCVKHAEPGFYDKKIREPTHETLHISPQVQYAKMFERMSQ